MLISNASYAHFQVANLFKRVKSTIVALFCGFFDVSSMTQQLVKVSFNSMLVNIHVYILEINENATLLFSIYF